jgi:hypothetical protein
MSSSWSVAAFNMVKGSSSSSSRLWQRDLQGDGVGLVIVHNIKSVGQLRHQVLFLAVAEHLKQIF